MRTILRPVVPGLVCGFAISTTLISALLTASLLLAMPQSARAQTTHTVCDEGCDFSSPEGAVSSPTVVNGDIIDVLNGVYTLGSTILVDKSITLLGNDSVFDANGLRAIDVSGAPTNFSLTNLTIRNGQADAGFGGGALRVSDGAVVNIVNVNFEDNQADFGGAAHNDGSTLYINASVFSGNRATAGNGGAIFADGDGTTNVNQTTVDGNLASIAGGGLAAAGGASINVNASTISGNAALSPSIVVDNFTATGTTNYCGVGPFGQTFVPGTSVISGFKYKIRRGGSAIAGDLVVPGRLREGGPTGPLLATTTTIIPGGTAPSVSLELTFVLDQPIAVDPFATYAIETDVLGDYSVYMTPAGSYANGDLYPCNTILNVGDYDFQILGGTPGDGGGVYATGLVDLGNRSSIGLGNSTLSSNIGDGGFATDGATVSTFFSTVTLNSGNGLTAVPDQPDVAPQGFVFFTTSIIAGNEGSDCDGNTFNLTSSGFNLIGDDTNCPFFQGEEIDPESDQVGSGEVPIDPLLGPLQDNGGRAFTHAIDENSPAFDAAGTRLDTYCSAASQDQLGTLRPNGLNCDIGSFELDFYGPLQTLINEAAPGATIVIPDGVYTEQITIGDGKILRASSPGSVTIDATGLGGSAIIAEGDFTLENIRVTGGNTAGDGGGINADISDTDITLIRVEFENNNATSDGGAIYLGTGNSLSVSDSTFTQNQAGGAGGAIASAGPIDSSHNRFDDNSADYGGAIHTWGEVTYTFDSDNDLFTRNQATYEGGAISNANSNLTIANDSFQGNTAGSDDGESRVAGDGGAIFNASDLSLINSTIDSSNAGRGGGVYNDWSSNLTISGSTLHANNADSYDAIGGAIGGRGTIEVNNSTLSGNTSIGESGNGGGIGLLGGTARLNNVTLAFNAASGFGGAFYANSGEPGALIQFSNSLLSDNTGGATNCSTFESLGYNLFQSAPCPALASDIIGEPLIGFLASNGGPTQTHALYAASPARDAADPGQLVIELSSALSAGQLSFNGAASQAGGLIVPVSGEFVAGSIFASTPDEGPFDLTGSFSTQFSFQITDPVAWASNPGEPSGDGFTFAIAASPTVLGEAGGRLGVATSPGPLGTVSVEFDTYAFIGDVSSNAIGVNVGGVGDGQSVISATQAAIPGAFDDGNIWTAWIDYRADSQRLEIRVATDGVRPDFPQLTHTVDIAAEVGATGYYGFTGGTGLAYATHTVTAWEFFSTNCPTYDQRGVARPHGAACDIGAVEGSPIPLALGSVTLSATPRGGELDNGTSYPGVVEIPIIDIPIEKLTGDTFNAPESAPLGSFPLGSFPIGSFDLQSSPLGSFPLGSFPLGSFPLGSFPLASIPLQTIGGWREILSEYPELAGAPPQTVTLERLLTLSSGADSVANIQLRDLSILDSPLASLSLPGLALGGTTVAELDEWATNAGKTGDVCDTLHDKDPSLACGDLDTLLSLESKGAPVSALSLSSLPLGSFPIGSFPLGSFPIGSFPLGSFPLGSFPLGSFPLGSFPLGSFPLGSIPLGSFPLGSFNLLAAPLGSFPLGSFPLGSFPLGSFEIDGKSFCEFYDEQADADGSDTCAELDVNPASDSLADLIVKLADSDGNINIGSTPLGSFPMGSFPIGSFPLGSFDLGTLSTPPISELKLAAIDGCTQIDIHSSDTCSSLGLDNDSSLAEAYSAYDAIGGSLAASPLGSFPIGSFDVAGLPMGSFPLGSFKINGTPLGSFPLGSFDLINSPLGSFPLGSFADGPCANCETLADAAKAGVIDTTAILEDLAGTPDFDATTLGIVLDAMTLAILHGPGTLEDIEDPGNLTLGQMLIAMMLKTDFPWETIPLDQLNPQEFSADHFIDYEVDFQLTGTEQEKVWVRVTMADSFLYEDGSATLDVTTSTGPNPTVSLSDPDVYLYEGKQILTFKLLLGGYTDNTVRFTAIPPLALGDYPTSAQIVFVSDIVVIPGSVGDSVIASAGSASSTKSKVSASSKTSPVVAAAEVVGESEGMLTVIPDPKTNSSESNKAITAKADTLILGFIDSPSDNDYFKVAPPAAGDRVAVFMSNPVGDNDLIMYEPLSTVEAKGQLDQAPPLDSVPFEDDGVDYQGNLSEEPNALEDVNLAASPLASISTNRGTIDESVSAIAGNDEPFIIQVSGYNGARSVQPYTLRVKVTPQVPQPQCSARTWPGTANSTVLLAGTWTTETNAVFLVNGSRLASSDPGGPNAADDALTAINNLVNAPGIIDGVVVDVSGIYGVDYTDWDANPCRVDAPNSIVNAITQYLDEQRRDYSPKLAYVTIVGSDEVIPFARKPDETSIANESTFAGEFADNAMYGALVTRHFLSDDTYGDIDPVAWLDRYLNVPELGVGRLVEAAADIQTAAENYIASAGILDPQTALSAGYDFIADASIEIDEAFRAYSPLLGYGVEPALIDPAGIMPETDAWTRKNFLDATRVNTADPVDLVSFNMHFDFDEALPSIGDATDNPSAELIHVSDLDGADLTGGIWFTVGCHSGTSVADVSVVGAPSQDWAQTFSRAGALYLAQNAYGLGDTEAVALTERLMANFARNLNGNLTIGQAHAFAKQQYFADLGLYGEYDFKALQAATLFGLPMYQYGLGVPAPEPPAPPLPVAADPLSGLPSASWSLSNTGIQRSSTSKGDLFSVDGEVQFVHFRPLQPIVRRDVTGPNGTIAGGAFLTTLTTQDKDVTDMAFARPVIDLGENEAEIESDEVVFPTAFTNIATFNAPPPAGGPFAPRQQLNVIVGQFTSPQDGSSSGTERLFRSFDAQVFYRQSPSAGAGFAAAASAGGSAGSVADDFLRPELDNVQATLVGHSGGQQAAFSVDAFDENEVLRVAILYLQSVSDEPDPDIPTETSPQGNWVLVDLVRNAGTNTWTGGGPVDLSGVADGEIDFMVQALDANGNVANSTFKGEFYVAEEASPPPEPDPGSGNIGVVVTVGDDEVDPGDWITTDPVDIEITDQNPEIIYEYSVDFAPFTPLDSTGFQIEEDGVHTVTVRESDGRNPVTFVVLIDTTPPQAAITTPSEGGFVVQGQAPAADFDCLDAGSGIESCVGTAPDGAPVPASTTGGHTFTVTAQDDAQLGPTVAESTYFVVKPLEISGPGNAGAIADAVTVTGSATDLAEFEETVTIDWGDGSPSEMLDLSGSSVSSFSSDHVYPFPGIFQITVTVDYAGQFTLVGVVDFVTVYDPDGAWVLGEGKIESPAGAYTPYDSSDLDVTGKAEFEFNLKYKYRESKKGKGEDEGPVEEGVWVLNGNTKFLFRAAGIEFKTKVNDWMVIAGAHARYQGETMVGDGSELYKFQITVLDADIPGAGVSQDGFRIIIWRVDTSGVEIVLYDNGMGADDATGSAGTTSLSEGKIKIKESKEKS